MEKSIRSTKQSLFKSPTEAQTSGSLKIVSAATVKFTKALSISEKLPSREAIAVAEYSPNSRDEVSRSYLYLPTWSTRV